MKSISPNISLSFKHPFLKIATLLTVSLALFGCGQAKHEPRAGEYGENLVNSIRLTVSEIQAINQAIVTKPKDSFDRPSVDIGFLAEPGKNPYRFVLVAKGVAMQAGEIELKWIGGVQSETSNGYSPEIFQEDDKHSYEANEPVLLVISSDPFSVNTQSNALNYAVHAELLEAANFQLQSVELQVWQGKGSLYNWTYYLKFLVILMVVIFGIYRLVSR